VGSISVFGCAAAATDCAAAAAAAPEGLVAKAINRASGDAPTTTRAGGEVA